MRPENAPTNPVVDDIILLEQNTLRRIQCGSHETIQSVLVTATINTSVMMVKGHVISRCHRSYRFL